jgi:hypothetical protein
MSASKTNKERKGKVEAFKEKAKEQAKQQAVPKTHLIPLTEWPSTENLDLRGDLMDALEQQMVATYQNLAQARQLLNETQNEFQKAAHVLQMIIQQNIKAGKIKLNYQWNNGEDATPEEVTQYETEMQKLRDLQRKQFEESQKQQNAAKTGLVGADGQPVGTTQSLEEDEDNDSTSAQADQSRAAAEDTNEG